MTYADYLDYWMKEYFEINFKYTTAKRYKDSFTIVLGHRRIETTEKYYILSTNNDKINVTKSFEKSFNFYNI